jgi:hypothetical protein
MPQIRAAEEKEPEQERQQRNGGYDKEGPHAISPGADGTSYMNSKQNRQSPQKQRTAPDHA